MRVFLDTNVLVAAFATRGLCADVVRVILAEHELLTSPTVLDELSRTLTKKIRLPEQTTRDILSFLKTHATIVTKKPAMPPVKVRDKDDVVVLGEALAGEAELLVTGDKDLLTVGDLSSIRIVDPRGFWQIVRREPG